MDSSFLPFFVIIRKEDKTRKGSWWAAGKRYCKERLARPQHNFENGIGCHNRSLFFCLTLVLPPFSNDPSEEMDHRQKKKNWSYYF
jgi:hypothetical protein